MLSRSSVSSAFVFHSFCVSYKLISSNLLFKRLNFSMVSSYCVEESGAGLIANCSSADYSRRFYIA